MTIYKKFAAAIINLVFGAGLFFSFAYIILMSNGFAATWRENLEMALFTLCWLVLCIWYNRNRYRAMQEKTITCGKTGYWLTGILPFVLWIVLILMVAYL